MTTDKETLGKLLDRVRAATGPDRELEIALVEAFYGPGEAVLHEVHHIRSYECLSSVDAALAMAERVLPGWHVAVGTVGENDGPWACITEPIDPCADFAAFGSDIPSPSSPPFCPPSFPR